MVEKVGPAKLKKLLSEHGSIEEVCGILNAPLDVAEKEIENTKFWGDSLKHYADRKDDYFEAVKELFTFVLATARPNVSTDLGKTNPEKELEEIRKKYEIEPDDFWKLRRRATEFFRIAFATHLGIVFQPLREEADEKICGQIPD